MRRVSGASSLVNAPIHLSIGGTEDFSRGDEDEEYDEEPDRDEGRPRERGPLTELLLEAEVAQEVVPELEEREDHPRDRPARDVTRREEDARAEVALSLARGGPLPGIDPPAHETAEEDRRGGAERQIDPHGEGQGGDS